MNITSPTSATFRNRKVKPKKTTRVHYCEPCLKKLDDQGALPEGKVFQVTRQ